MKLYIISNRLPVKVTGLNGTFVFSRSEGGLATGLNSLETSYEKHWIGWPGLCLNTEDDKKVVTSRLGEMDFHPVFLSKAQVENYYEGYSNSTIWPLCHYFFAYTSYKKCYWETYKEVNRQFCEEIRKLVKPGDRVWVQDYQLMLLPAMLREACPDLCIGYFHHIPFPSYELFRVLPERDELLKGLLGADFIAFHTNEYMRHFISSAERVLHINFKLDEVRMGDRVVRVDALPMGINYDLYHKSFDKPEVRQAIDRNQQFFGDNKLMLSVDRLDYSKGILHRLGGFSSFLEHHPEYRGKISLAMVIVPSRDQVDSYAELKTRIDEEIGAINGKYSTMDWTPVSYFYHAFSFEELTAMYYMADIALVTPLRDGMNLVAKEYVATKRENTGVLILSEMAGASAELVDALRINPNDTDEIEAAICKALEMPEEEQKERLKRMQQIVSTQTVNKWAADFVDSMNACFLQNAALREKRLGKTTAEAIRRAYLDAGRRLILLDYDGTLAAIRKRPEEACPTEEVLALLARLAEDPANHVVINSGRDRLTLDDWFGNLPISLAAEHGSAYKEAGVWHKKLCPHRWDEELLAVLRKFLDKTPLAHLEMKESALAWHYRESDAWLGNLRARQLVHALMPVCMRLGLQILEGDKVVEIKSPDCNKGSEVNRLLAKGPYDFILAMGDDTTDEDMFKALPKEAITIKIGAVSEQAIYQMPFQQEVVPFLQTLANANRVEAERNTERFWKPALDYVMKVLKRDWIVGRSHVPNWH